MARTRGSAFIVAAIAGLVTACSPPTRYKTYYIPSESMAPTLQVNDRVMSDRLTQGSNSPQRGEIVIFRPPNKLTEMMQGAIEITNTTVFVKRVVGLPGEVIEVREGKVFINNQPLPEPYLAESPDYLWGPVKIPPDAYVVFGDNRNNAFDSHFWGVVPRDHLVGKVFWRYWPPARFGAIEPSKP